MRIDKKKFLRIFGLLMAQDFADAAPKDTATLANSFLGTMKIEGDNIVFSLPDYWIPVEYGSLPHEITPKNKKALAFKKGGKKIVVKKVMHPGNAPTFFIRNTIDRKAEINAMIALQHSIIEE